MQGSNLCLLHREAGFFTIEPPGTDRQTEQTKSPEIMLCIYSQLTFDRVLKQFNREKITLFKKSEQLDIHTVRMKLYIYFTSYTKMDSKWKRVLNIRAKTRNSYTFL